MKVDQDSLLTIVASGQWPIAAQASQMVGDEESSKNLRADNILQKMVKLKKDIKFLDFGCGEGHIVSRASAISSGVFGYDSMWQGWDRHENGNFTIDIEEMESNAPYDSILLYDVLDHIDDPISTLHIIKQVLAPNGIVHIRNHPFTSIHGTHLYNTLNYAWIHLLMQEADIRKLGGVSQRVNRITRPLATYRGWFSDIGFKIKREEIIRSQIPPMFHDQEIITAIAKQNYRAGLQGGARICDKDVMHSLISIQFVDYELMV